MKKITVRKIAYQFVVCLFLTACLFWQQSISASADTEWKSGFSQKMELYQEQIPEIKSYIEEIESWIADEGSWRESSGIMGDSYWVGEPETLEIHYYTMDGEEVSESKINVKLLYLQGKLHSTKEYLKKIESEYEDLYSMFHTTIELGNSGVGMGVNITPAFSNNEFRGLNELLYGSSNQNTTARDTEQEKLGKIEEWVAEPLANLAIGLYRKLSSWNVDITIDGLIYGRMNRSRKSSVDYTHFGFESNNPYGLVGASAFYVLRRILLSAMPVIVMFGILSQAFKNEKKEREQTFKAQVKSFLVVMVLLFATPYILYYCFYARDALLLFLSYGMQEILGSSLGFSVGGLGGSIVASFYDAFITYKSLMNAVLLCAAVGSSFFYLVTYLRIALLLCGCFAILPICLFCSIWNKKIINEWWNVFFPNLCAPIVDAILFMVPVIVQGVYIRLNGASFSAALVIVELIIIWVTIAVRDRILKLLGFEPFRSGLGMAAMAMMALRSLGNRAKQTVSRGASSGGSGGGAAGGGALPDRMDDGILADEQKNRSEEMRRALGEDPDVSGGLRPDSSGKETDDYLDSLDVAPASDSGTAEPEGVEAGTETSVDVEGTEVSAEASGAVGDVSGAAGDAPVEEGEVGDFPAETVPYDSPEALASGHSESDAAFIKNEMSDMERSRFANLEQMERVDEHLESTNAKIKDFEEMQSRAKSLDKQIAMETEAYVKAPEVSADSHVRAKSEIGDRLYGLKHEREQLSLDMEGRYGDGKALYAQRDRLSASRLACEQKESRFAVAAKIGGMRGGTYESSDTYLRQCKIDAAVKKQADFRNFESKRFEGILTPDEREQFYRERAAYDTAVRRIEQVGSVGRHVVNAGIVAASASAAAVSLYGGPGAVAVAGAPAASRVVANTSNLYNMAKGKGTDAIASAYMHQTTKPSKGTPERAPSSARKGVTAHPSGGGTAAPRPAASPSSKPKTAEGVRKEMGKGAESASAKRRSAESEKIREAKRRAEGAAPKRGTDSPHLPGTPRNAGGRKKRKNR